MPSCAAWNCNYSTANPGGRTFHLFPNDPEKRQQWISNLRRTDFWPSKHVAVCSDHFEPSCFDHSGPTDKLHESAVPTIFSYPENLAQNTTSLEGPLFQLIEPLLHVRNIKSEVSDSAAVLHGEESMDSSGFEENVPVIFAAELKAHTLEEEPNLPGSQDTEKGSDILEKDNKFDAEEKLTEHQISAEENKLTEIQVSSEVNKQPEVRVKDLLDNLQGADYLKEESSSQVASKDDAVPDEKAVKRMSKRIASRRKWLAARKFKVDCGKQNPLIQRGIKHMTLEFLQDDCYLYCEECNKEYEGDCPVHGPLEVVENSQIIRAACTLPAGMKIKHSKIPGAGSGVFATREFACRSLFGPYEGEIKDLESVQPSDYLWLIYSNGRPSHVIDGENPTIANWMRYVNCARNKEEHNLIAFQYHGQIYYRSCKKIVAGSELLVWYGNEYAKQLGIPRSVLPRKKRKRGNDRFLCDFCPLEFSVEDHLTKHMVRWHLQESLDCKDNPIPSRLPHESRDGADVSFENEDDGNGDVSDMEDLADNMTAAVALESLKKKKAATATASLEQEDTTGQLDSSMHHLPAKQLAEIIKKSIAMHTPRKISYMQEKGEDGTVTYKCKECGEVNSELKHMRKHLRSHKTKQGKKRAKEVQQSENPAEPVCHVCECCGKSVATKLKLRLHMRSHKKNRLQKFRCEHCAKEFTNSFNLRRHRRTHTGERPYSCMVCGKSFPQTQTLKEHLRIHTKEWPHKCESCGKGFNTPFQLRVHMRRHTGEKPYQCKFCGKGFTHLPNLNLHTRIHTGEKPLMCVGCGQKFGELDSLNTHTCAHTGEKPHQCEQCGKSYGTSQGLIQHRRKHTGERPYQCDQCGKSFSTSPGLMQHLRVHSGERPNHCDVCGKRFSAAQGLQRHMKIHTGERPYHCEYCGKTFTQLTHLHNHRKIHTGDKPYRCELCDKGFCISGNLDQHIKTHNTSWPYVCEYCGKFLRSQQLLQNHISNHTLIQLESAIAS